MNTIFHGRKINDIYSDMNLDYDDEYIEDNF